MPQGKETSYGNLTDQILCQDPLRYVPLLKHMLRLQSSVTFKATFPEFLLLPLPALWRQSEW